MSAASGFVFYYQEDDVFRRMAGSLAKKYDRHNMFDLFYDRRPSRGEQWALMLRVIHYIYECYTGETYTDLAELLKGKDYYIATTNQDAQFYRVFPAERITRIQGDWRYWQCSRPCHDEIYDNKEKVYRLVMMPCPMNSYPAARIAARSWLRGCVVTLFLKANITNGR